MSAGNGQAGPVQDNGLSSEARDFITRAASEVVEGLAARLDALGEQLAAIHQAQAGAAGPVPGRPGGEGGRAVIGAARAAMATGPLSSDARRGYRQLITRTLESLDAASRNLDTLREDMGKLRESAGTVDQQAAGLMQGIKAVRARLDEVHAGIDAEGDANPGPGEGGEGA